ncbi:MAG: Mrp/NBP35 family ATP-binding protein [Coriobacteriales bacterium]|nr:Mrp/NBP35 family ATP-binding protein [Coriobacteriales bacterium]
MVKSQQGQRGCSNSSCSKSSCEGCPSANGGAIEKIAPLPGVNIKHVIGIVSGKGGVGKSLTTSALAYRMLRKGASVAILDADATGPSIPRMVGLKGQLYTRMLDEENYAILPARNADGIQVTSTNLMLPNETDPVIWRGAVIAGMIRQFWTETDWGDVDYMFVDMPPGTGDVPLSVFQTLPVDGIVIVTSPQELVGMIVSQAVNMAEKMNVPVLGIVENMSFLKCPDCGKEIKVFGESHIDEIAWEHGIDTIAKLPMDPAFAAACDAGKVGTLPMTELDPIVQVIEAL